MWVKSSGIRVRVSHVEYVGPTNQCLLFWNVWVPLVYILNKKTPVFLRKATLSIYNMDKNYGMKKYHR
jgi:hypothetical protein